MRRRVSFVIRAAVTIGLGLIVHLGETGLSGNVRDVLGDALWAMMIAWWVGALAPNARLAWRSTMAYALCVGVEVSQLLHTPALDAMRATVLGRLVLGSGFDARDLAAYAVGIAMAMLIERVAPVRPAREPR